jgi:hypothetical protein
MLKAQEIIAGLNSIANKYAWFAVFWHVVFYILVIAFIANWEPSNKLIGTLICIPLFSVAFFAWITGNPFNGVMFTVMGILILLFGLKSSVQSIQPSQLPYVISGIVMIAFGLIYPHFIETSSIFNYFYASPVGLIPCPTLSILIGFILIFNGFGSQSITSTFILFGLFYGLFGVIKLAVYLDLFLVFGTLTLLIKLFIAKM